MVTGGGARGQRGLALVLMTLVLVLGTTFVMVDQMSTLSQRLGQDRTTREALAMAKEALIGYAARHDTQPGALPCPDTDNDGVAESSCSGANQRAGRLPWKTLGLPELRDSAGERLWYALSDAFRVDDTRPINSSTSGELTLREDAGGTVLQNAVVALLIGPGAQLAGQDRSGASDGSPNKLSIANYLEGKNNTAQDAGAVNDDVFVQPTATAARPRGECLVSGAAADCNDRMLAITHADVFNVVEPAVASKIDKAIKPYLATYASQWGGRYPFPAAFANPDPGTNGSASTRPQSAYTGDTSLDGVTPNASAGLMPITGSAPYSYVAGSGSVSLTGGTAQSVTLTGCASATDGFQCTFSIAARNNWFICWPFQYCMVNPAFQVIGAAANVGTSFADLADADVTVTNPATGAARAMSSTGLARSLAASGDATLTFSGTHSYSRYNNVNFNRNMRVTFPIVPSALTSATDPLAGWFVSNQWYRLTYYAVSPGFLPAAAGSCAFGATPSCLKVDNMPSAYAAPDNDKRALLILAGRPLNASARPSSSPADYLEGGNTTPLDFTFEHRSGALAANNDRVVVVAP